MKNILSYLVAMIIVGAAVYAIMHWLFHFNNPDSIMYGIIAAIVEPIITFFRRYIWKNKKTGSV